MEKSLWKAQYQSPTGSSSTGITTLDNGLIYGGNAIFYFTGEYDANNKRRSTATVRIKRYADGPSILGPVDEGTLVLSGTMSDNTIFFSGYLESNPACKVTAKMEKLIDLLPPDKNR